MELTPQVINEVEFSMARRGYDPDQVDEFLEKVAVAVAELTAGLADARSHAEAAERRAEEAERRAAERPERVVGPAAASVSAAAEAELETLKRTLVLAQKTADAAVKEAEAEARRIIGAAEGEARAAHEDTRKRLVEELSSLEAAREGLRDDMRSLERHLEEQRLRVRGSIAELQRLLDDPSRLKAAPLPPSVAAATAAPAAPVARPAPLTGPPLAPPAPVVAAPAKAASPATAAPAVVREPAARTAPADTAAEPAAAAAEPAAAADGPFANRLARPAPARSAGGDDADEEAWARFGTDDDGPPTRPVLRLDDAERASADGDDAYLSELRKAMLEDTGAPDMGEEDLLDIPGEGRSGRSRFGRRR